MPSRRPHAKTRHGCTACKTRRVRCDLGQPTCRACSARGEACEYPLAGGTVSQSLEQLSDTTPVPDPEADILNLELMHLYTTASYLTLADDGKSQRAFQIFIPRMAFTCPFLLHGILAFAARHLAWQNVSRRVTLNDLASRYQHAALQEYIPCLQNVDEKSCHAVFAFSVVLAALSYSQFNTPSLSVSQQDYLDVFIDDVELLIGASSVAITTSPWLRRGDLVPLLKPWPEPMPKSLQQNAEVTEALRALLQAVCVINGTVTEMNTWVDVNPENVGQTYVAAIQRLSVTIPLQGFPRPTLHVLLAWPVKTGKLFVSQLRQRDSIALTILAFYCIALHESDEIWFLEGVGYRLIEFISREVTDMWQPHVARAMEFVRKKSAGASSSGRREN